MTFVANSALTAAQLNTFIRDNLNETAPARATTAGSLFVSTTDNAIAERPNAQGDFLTAQSTTQTTYVDVATPGPSVTLTTGAQAIVFLVSEMANTGAGGSSYVTYVISGATNASASDLGELIFTQGSSLADDRYMSVSWVTGLTPGSNTFTMKYKVSFSSGTFTNRYILVMTV